MQLKSAEVKLSGKQTTGVNRASEHRIQLVDGVARSSDQVSRAHLRQRLGADSAPHAAPGDTSSEKAGEEETSS